MNSKNLFLKVIDIIDKKYIFTDNQKINWLSNLENFQKKISTINTDIEMFLTINKLLLTLEDPHTKLYKANITNQIHDIDFTWVSNKIIILPNIFGYSTDIIGGELLEINDIPIENIFNIFYKNLKTFPIGIIRDYILNYIKSTIFNDNINIKVKKSEKIFIENIEKKSLFEIKEKYSLNTFNIQNNPISFKQIDTDILMIKIFHLDLKDYQIIF